MIRKTKQKSVHLKKLIFREEQTKENMRDKGKQNKMRKKKKPMNATDYDDISGIGKAWRRRFEKDVIKGE